MARALVTVPATAKRGEIIEIRALIGHAMETGYRPGPDGKILARDIIRSFSCRYNGEQVFAAQLHPAISANPYIAFSPWRPRAVPWNSSGRATTALRRRRRPGSR